MNEAARPESSRTVLIALLAVCLIAIAAVLFLVLRPEPAPPETVVEVVEAAAPAEVQLHVAQVVDTLANPGAVAEEGARYKVLIVDEAREGASGIAKIGGLVTFVPETRRGDLVVIEVSRLKRSTADARLIERLASGQPVPERAPRDQADRTPRHNDAAAPSVLVGQEFRGTVEDMGREGDGIVKVDGKVVFVKGAAMGEHVVFRVTEDAGRFARGEVVSKSDTPFAAPSVAPAATQVEVKENAPPVAVGDELEVEVVEGDRRNPTVDGVARIDRFVVFVPGTQPGDRARIRITDVRSRAAQAEVLERLPASP